MAISQLIPIEHRPALQEVVAEAPEDLPPLTLLELIQAVDEVSESDIEVVATVRYMMDSGRIKLMAPERPNSAARL